MLLYEKNNFFDDVFFMTVYTLSYSGVALAEPEVWLIYWLGLAKFLTRSG